MPLQNTHLGVFASDWDIHVYFSWGWGIFIFADAAAPPCVCRIHEVAEDKAVHPAGIHADTKHVLHHGPTCMRSVKMDVRAGAIVDPGISQEFEVVSANRMTQANQT